MEQKILKSFDVSLVYDSPFCIFTDCAGDLNKKLQQNLTNKKTIIRICLSK